MASIRECGSETGYGGIMPHRFIRYTSAVACVPGRKYNVRLMFTPESTRVLSCRPVRCQVKVCRSLGLVAFFCHLFLPFPYLSCIHVVLLFFCTPGTRCIPRNVLLPCWRCRSKRRVLIVSCKETCTCFYGFLFPFIARTLTPPCQNHRAT